MAPDKPGGPARLVDWSESVTCLLTSNAIKLGDLLDIDEWQIQGVEQSLSKALKYQGGTMFGG